MKLKGIKHLILLVLTCVSIGAIAQDSATRKARTDSLARVEQRKNSDNLSDLKSEKTDTRAKAKEAQRVERNANTAARESRNAYRTEQKAQKSRKKADRQAKKAARSRVESDNN